MTTAGTRVEMATQGCCAAVLDSAKHFQLLKAEARPVSVEKAVALCANEIGHLQVGSFLSFTGVETIRCCRDRKMLERIDRLLQMAARQVEIDAGRFQVGVAE